MGLRGSQGSLLDRVRNTRVQGNLVSQDQEYGESEKFAEPVIAQGKQTRVQRWTAWPWSLALSLSLCLLMNPLSWALPLSTVHLSFHRDFTSSPHSQAWCSVLGPCQHRARPHRSLWTLCASHCSFSNLNRPVLKIQSAPDWEAEKPQPSLGCFSPGKPSPAPLA